jgi:hypothetical protein
MLPDPGHIRREPATNYISFLLNCQFHEVTAVCRCEQDFSQSDRLFREGGYRHDW